MTQINKLIAMTIFGVTEGCLEVVFIKIIDDSQFFKRNPIFFAYLSLDTQTHSGSTIKYVSYYQN